MPDFIHLHNHSDYSLLDGAASIKNLIKKAVSLEMKHLAITDHGNMFGVLHFYKACRENGINPIIGCEFYTAPGSRLVKSGSEKGNKYNHLILLAKNLTGYKNLILLTSRGYTEGFYYKPRIDDELLEQHSEGLICLSACLAGAVPQAILNNQKELAVQKALKYKKIFGEGNFYLELQDHGIPEQKTAAKGIIEISKETGIPLVVTNDIHYLEKEHANAQDIFICIGTNRKKIEKDRMKFKTSEFYFKTKEEMAILFPNNPEVLSNTVNIAEKCNLEIPLDGPLLPEYEIPPEFTNPDEYMRHITRKGLEGLYPEITEEIKQRADFELDTIIEMGFTGYFLIVWDFIAFARKKGIPVGPGRGSGAGSIVAYGMRITDIDPLKYNLLFERFLNPERVSMPDFDIDFCYERRGEVIDYVTEKYGSDKVGAICTFGTLKTKAVLKDVARVLDIPFAESNEISKLIPEGSENLNDAIEKEPRLKEYSVKGGIYTELVDTARILEGLNRHSSTHACGMVIGKTKLTDYVPLFMDQKTGQISTEFTMDQLEECGLVKMDFLGLKTLTLIANTEKLIQKKTPGFSVENIVEEDKATYEMLSEGKSTAVFQFESSGMQGILKRTKPETLEELIALNALYRPGPMQFIDQYIDSKRGKQAIVYPHPLLEDILKPTYGVIVYQEQVMQVAQIIAGFSLGHADILRRAMGKKKIAVMHKEKIKFISGAGKKGISEKKAAEIFEILIPFAGYGFNKSHAAAYSVIAYKTAYLKANYPAEFMAANLTNEINNPDPFAQYMAAANDMGLEILPPDINMSEKKFTVVEGRIFYGLMGIKNVGSAAVDEIISARNEKGNFTSFIDFLEKADLKTINRKVIETIIQAGLFDNMGTGRSTLIFNLERILEFVNNKKNGEKFGQVSLFDNEEHTEFHNITLETVEEWPDLELLRLEKENLGFYFSGHPLEKYKKVWEDCTTLNLINKDKVSGDKKYTIMGMIKSLKQIITKKGAQMAFAEIEDFEGSIELTFFPKTWEIYREMLDTDVIIGITGKLDRSRGDTQILVDTVQKPEDLEIVRSQAIHVKLAIESFKEEDLYNLRAFLDDPNGECALHLHIPEQNVTIKAGTQITVSSDDEYLTKIKNQPGVIEVWKE